MPAVCLLLPFTLAAQQPRQQSTHAVLNYLVFNHGLATLSQHVVFPSFFFFALSLFPFPFALVVFPFLPQQFEEESRMINDRFALSLLSSLQRANLSMECVTSKVKLKALEMKFDFVPWKGSARKSKSKRKRAKLKAPS